MPTRYFPASVAVPAHMDKMPDKQIVQWINAKLYTPRSNDSDDQLPYDSVVLIPLVPDQFVATQPEAAKAVAREVTRSRNRRQRGSRATAVKRATRKKGGR